MLAEAKQVTAEIDTKLADFGIFMVNEFSEIELPHAHSIYKLYDLLISVYKAE